MARTRKTQSCYWCSGGGTVYVHAHVPGYLRACTVPLCGRCRRKPNCPHCGAPSKVVRAEEAKQANLRKARDGHRASFGKVLGANVAVLALVLEMRDTARRLSVLARATHDPDRLTLTKARNLLFDAAQALGTPRGLKARRAPHLIDECNAVEHALWLLSPSDRKPALAAFRRIELALEARQRKPRRT